MKKEDVFQKSLGQGSPQNARDGVMSGTFFKLVKLVELVINFMCMLNKTKKSVYIICMEYPSYLITEGRKPAMVTI